MSLEAISNKQFGTERSLLEQGNTDDLAARVRGFQHATANIFKPAFPEDYTTVRSMPSGTQFKSGGMGEEEEGGM
jgi:hypothetical protein